MISDSERREVARRLRELHLGGGSKDLIERTLSDAIGAWRESGMSWDFITERLADLIEPSFDRDELLALADEIRSTSCDNDGELTVDLIDVWGWSQAIREALGVADG